MRVPWSWVSLPPGTEWNDQTLGEMNRRMKVLEHALKYMGDLVAGGRTSGDGDTDPSVSGIRLLDTANTSSTTITAFGDGEPNQILIVKMGDANTTVQHGPYLKLNGDVDWVGGVNQTRLFVTEDGTTWIEVPYVSSGVLDTLATEFGAGSDNIDSEDGKDILTEGGDEVITESILTGDDITTEAGDLISVES